MLGVGAVLVDHPLHVAHVRITSHSPVATIQCVALISLKRAHRIARAQHRAAALKRWSHNIGAYTDQATTGVGARVRIDSWESLPMLASATQHALEGLHRMTTESD